MENPHNGLEPVILKPLTNFECQKILPDQERNILSTEQWIYDGCNYTYKAVKRLLYGRAKTNHLFLKTYVQVL